MTRITKMITFTCILVSTATLSLGQQGFFLDSWKPRTFVQPGFNEVPKPPATSTVSVAIHPGTVISKVPATLFGNNSNPYMTQMVTEPVLINHIKALSPNIIRFPGGNISSVFFWNADKDQPPATAPDSLYDSEGRRVKAGYWYGKNNDSWTLSVQNYYRMLEQTNSTGIITANYSYARYGLSENPVAAAAHLAADWVRYDSGRTKYWEIGNEDSGPWQAGFKINTITNSDGQPEVISGTVYGNHLKVFADSMRKAAAETGKAIYIGAQLIQYDAATSWNAPERNWNAEYFAAAGNTADYYIIHSYYTPFAANSTAAEILKSAADETRLMMNWMKTTTTRAGVEMKPIALTEWNIFAEGSMQSVSHINGLHAALVLGELIKEKYGLAARWDLANGWSNGNDHGTFNQGDEPGGAPKWNPRPSFFHMYFFQKIFGDEMIQSDVSGSQDIISYASRYHSGEIGVVLVNKGTTARIVNLGADNFTAGRYFWYTLTGGGDNGQFSRKVLVNGTGPAGISGGPLNYETLKANSVVAQGTVTVEVPPHSAVYLVMGKGEITAVNDVDQADKFVKLFPNPSVGSSFYLDIRYENSNKPVKVFIYDSQGRLVINTTGRSPSQMHFNQSLRSGSYKVVVHLFDGTTVKNLIVP